MTDEVAPRGSKVARTVDITPTWNGVLPLYLEVIRNGDWDAQEAVKAELFRLANYADQQRELAKVENEAAEDLKAGHAEFLKIAEQVGEEEDPYAAWEVIDKRMREHAAMRDKLTEIACFGDKGASELLALSGSYGMFDEPGAVEAARTCLKALFPGDYE